MLLQLSIKNFALIEDLTINFEKGFNVLTGETGTGKSILIDAINYVLGDKFNKNLIRTGENKTYVEAIFDIEDNIVSTLKEMNIDFEDILIISRETFKSGKSVVKINGKAFLISNVKKISNKLINIHGQHENQELLNWTSHIIYLDKFGEEKLKEPLSEYTKIYKEFLDINKQIEDLSGDNGEEKKLIDFLKYQLDEIDDANLKDNEDLKLQEKYSALANAEKISVVLKNSYNFLYNSSDNFISVYDLLNKVIKELRSIEDNIIKVKKISDSLEEFYYNIEQIVFDIRSLEGSIVYDKKELEMINSRIFQIDSLKRKYGDTIQDIFNYKQEITDKYNKIINKSQIIQQLKKRKEEVVKKLKVKSEVLHNIRIDISKDLETKIKKELDYVGLEKSIFKIKVELQEEFLKSGCDKIQFLISTNPGEPLKPLDKIVSGGELSRIMLSLKTVFVDKDEIPSVIFDEIDTGISGRIAQRVAEKMYIISRSHQVFCVTHLPQIATMSDCHFLVSKEVKDNKTYTNIRKINSTEKEYEIARMIGGSKITKLTLEHSKEMIKLARECKKNLIKNKIL